MAIGVRAALLILDNFEHLLAAAPLVADLLTRCPRLAVLATSRERLHLRGEHELVVPPLEVPAAAPGPVEPAAGLSGVAAVRLFVERAAAVRGAFALTAENAAAVAEICRCLDGLPLAIELAAGWAKIFSPAALLGRLEPSLPLLVGGARDLPDRQRTMRDAIAWSHDLLDPSERAFFRRLALFAGGFTLEAAAAVTSRGDEQPGWPEAIGRPPGSSSSALDLLASLVDKSLVRSLPTEAAGDVRFGMLET
ncbi:MAG: hypothetical protein H0V24_08120, partial [Chloroflexia bacterium]|nr:hypothetical protein [Chloroflexia bacterium]